MWLSDEIFWSKTGLCIILCVLSEELCGRARRKFYEQEGMVNGRCFSAFDMVLRDILLKNKNLTPEKLSS
jgi:hypothetical protein